MRRRTGVDLRQNKAAWMRAEGMRDEARRRIAQAAAEGWKELDLAGLKLTDLPPEIGQLRQLKRLILGKLN
jgi:Leucine-rich repeat (LRR) protein